MVEVSVIIPIRGHADVLAKCLRTVVSQQTAFTFEVIVVDSASDDATAEVTRSFDGVKLVRSETPLVPGPARNLGVAHASGYYLAFIDVDCIAMPGWLAAAHGALQEPNVRLVGGPVSDMLKRQWIASVDNLLQFADLPMTRQRGPARYFPACNIAMRADDFHACSGFPDTGIPGGEDILLCDAVLARWPNSLRFDPTMPVQHTGRESWGVYLQHHYMFGYCRALHNLHVKPWHIRLGRFAAMIPLMTLKRLIYLLRSGVRYRGLGVLRIVLLLPLVLPGLWYSALGFYRGCCERAQGVAPTPAPADALERVTTRSDDEALADAGAGSDRT